MNISEKVINRLTLYHFILDDYKDDTEFISSTRIAELLNIDDSQVRKDIKCLNNSGKCRVGYEIKKLRKAIEDTLGFKEKKSAFIIGAGNLGSALVKYDSFNNYGLNIVALFDVDKNKVGNSINGRKIYHASKLSDLVKKYNPDIAILTVPKEFAKEAANNIANSGIKYIWNFTSSILEVSDNVKTWNENLIGSFLQFYKN